MSEPTQQLAPRKMSLFDLETELVALTDELLGYSESGEQPPEELLQALAGGVQATAEKRDRVAAFLRFVEAQPVLIDEEIKRLKLRKQTIEKGAEHLRAYIYRVMVATNQRVLEGVNSTFKIVKNPPSLDAPDTSMLPDDLVRVDVNFQMTRAEYHDIQSELEDMVDQLELKSSPDKKRIAALLKNKQPVTGATLKQDERLEIK